ncbi:MAG: nucleoside hydrolase [Bacteroidales bacterium]|nr:nucleoside hydrolase [Bacteroidales bacterium]
MKIKSFFLSLALLPILISCSEAPKPVIFDTDWWTDVDDACALRLLLQEESEGTVDLLGVCLSAVCETSVPSLSSFLDYEGAGSMRIGADKQATDYPGKSKWHQTIIDNHPKRAVSSIDDVQDCVEFYRDLLSKSRKKVDIIAVGFPNAISRLLESDPELVTKKVGHLWLMAGKYPEGEEHNFILTERSRLSGENICLHWPTPVTLLGWEVGIKVRVGGSLPEDDLLHKVLVAHGSADGRYAWDPMTAWMACLGSPEMAGFKTVTGTVTLDPVTGKNSFIPKEDGPHRYVIMAHEPGWYSSAIEGILLKKHM